MHEFLSIQLAMEGRTWRGEGTYQVIALSEIKWNPKKAAGETIGERR
jgi:hypothetical protein